MHLVKLSRSWVAIDHMIAADEQDDGTLAVELTPGRVRVLRGPDATTFRAALERMLSCGEPDTETVDVTREPGTTVRDERAGGGGATGAA